jgi:mRNA-degrading endonuclease RelE of RelBE toxin-antitoxin system
MIVPSGKFKKTFKKMAKKYASLVNDYAAVEKELLTNPHAGVSLGEGYRKVRMAIRSKRKGKRGGVRIIAYELCLKVENDTLILVDIYDKAELNTVETNEYTHLLQKFIANHP